MKTYLYTRGKYLDYRFIAQEPDDIWWSVYSNICSFEEPAFVVEMEPHSWRVFFSGIPSLTRKDSVNTVIRNSFLFEGDSTSADLEKLWSFLLQWLMDYKKFSYLSPLCDSLFTGELIESCLQNTGECPHNMADAFLSLFNELAQKNDNVSLTKPFSDAAEISLLSIRGFKEYCLLKTIKNKQWWLSAIGNEKLSEELTALMNYFVQKEYSARIILSNLLDNKKDIQQFLQKTIPEEAKSIIIIDDEKTNSFELI